jgi:hypothetical protein
MKETKKKMKRNNSENEWKKTAKIISKKAEESWKMVSKKKAKKWKYEAKYETEEG